MDFVIAVDGTAASGKGTIAQGLARAYGLPYLDTGLLYRATALGVLRSGASLEDEAALEAAARAAASDSLGDPELRSAAVGEAASRVATSARVRAALDALQRDFARRSGGAVLDGRDIGTVIAPSAPAKLFIDAAVETRARRRLSQLGLPAHEDAVRRMADELIRRDERDRGRETAPLKRADDAVLLDTTEMDIPQAADAARRIVEAARDRWLSQQPTG